MNPRPIRASGDTLSLMRGGPVYRFLHRSGLINRGLPTARLLALLLLAVALLPLAVLAGLDGTLLPGRVTMPLVADYYVLARFLLVLPLLVLAAPVADGLLKASIRHLGRSGVVQVRKRDALARALHAVRRLRDSRIPELACLLLAVLPVLLLPTVQGDLQHLDSWRWHTGTGPTRAAQWQNLVSQPVFRFVLLVWLWRFLLWTFLLWRLSRIGMDLRPAHPDGAGGLGFLGVAQERFSVLALAGGLILSGNCMNHLEYTTQTLTDLHYLILGYIAGITACLLAPLLLMFPTMLRAKRHAFSRYSALAHEATRHFDERWGMGRDIRGEQDSLLDSAAPSALADFTAVYATLRAMSVVPISRWNVFAIAFAAALPFAPLVFFAMSLDQVAQKLFSILV